MIEKMKFLDGIHAGPTPRVTSTRQSRCVRIADVEGLPSRAPTATASVRSHPKGVLTMKTVYKATLLATATTLFCGLAIGQSRDVAPRVDRDARGTTPLQALPFATPARVAARPAFDPTATPRLPVLMLTQTYGDSAREMFAGGAVGYTLRNFPFQSTKTIVYLDVDTFNPRSRLNQEALALAKEAGWSVVIESDTWNAAAVRAMAYRLFPEARIETLNNTSIVVESTDAGLRVRDTWPSEVAAIAGVPYTDTTEGEVTRALSVPKKASIHWSAIFAAKAYERNPGDIIYENKRWQLGINHDVVKMWAYENPRVGPQCIVSWRGTDTTGDWLRNLQNAVGGWARVPGFDNSGSYIRIGGGLAARLSNYKLSPLQCREVYVTGHSLGGAMAQAYALREFVKRDWSDDPRENVMGVYAYNPARFGNYSAAVNLANSTVRGYPQKALQTYCRVGDPVHKLPAGDYYQGTYDLPGTREQCTHMAPRASANVIHNHRMLHWL
jgi:hypothetical protein